MALDPTRASLLAYAGRWVEPRWDAATGALLDTRSTAIAALYWAECGRYDRAARSVGWVLDAQQLDGSSAQFGLFPEYPSGTGYPANWHRFIGSYLLVLEARHGAQLPAALRGQVRVAVGAAASRARAFPVNPQITNLSVLDVFLLAGAGELLADPALVTEARSRWQVIAAGLEAGFPEYNAPNYATAHAYGLGFLCDYVQDPALRTGAQDVRRALWWSLTRRYHAATGQQAGPHGRSSPHDRMRLAPTGLQLVLHRESGGRVPDYYAEHLALMNRDLPLMGVLLAVVSPSCPAEWMDEALAPPAGPRSYVERARAYPEGGFQQTTTYMNGFLSVGSVNRDTFTATVAKGDGRPVIAYAGDSIGRTGCFRVVMECSSRVDGRFISAVQKDGAVLVVPTADRYLTGQPRDFTIRLQWFGNGTSAVGLLDANKPRFDGAFGVGWMGYPVVVRVSPLLMAGGSAAWEWVQPADARQPSEAVLRLTLPAEPTQGGVNPLPVAPVAWGIYFGDATRLMPGALAPVTVDGALYSWASPTGLLQQRLPEERDQWRVEQWADGVAVEPAGWSAVE